MALVMNYSHGSSPWFLLHQINSMPLKSDDDRRLSFCPAGTLLDPYHDAGYVCFLGWDIIGDSNQGHAETDCKNANGIWYLYNCQQALRHYQNDAELDEIDMFASWWNSTCCYNTTYEVPFISTTDEIRTYWWGKEKYTRLGRNRNFVIITGILGILSIIASATFIWMIMRSHDGLSTTQHRVLLGLCISDITFSMPQIIFGTMAPKELDYWSWNARGNMATCQIQGFLTVIGALSGPWYNASQGILFLSLVKYGKSDDYIRTRLEPFLLWVPPAVALSLSIQRLLTNGLNPDGTGNCTYFSNEPPHCLGAEEGFKLQGLFQIGCGRGRESWKVSFIVGFFAILFPPIIMVTCLVMIYRIVVETELKRSKYGAGLIVKRIGSSSSSARQGATEQDSWIDGVWVKLKQGIIFQKCSSRKNNSNVMSAGVTSSKRKKRQLYSRSILYKGIAYSFSWLLTWLFYCLCITYIVTTKREAPTELIYLVSLFHPLQGVYNLAIYMYPKIRHAKSSTRDSFTWRQAFVEAFWSKGEDKSKKKRGLRAANVPRTSRLRKKKKSRSLRDSSIKDHNVVEMSSKTSILQRKETLIIPPQMEERTKKETQQGINDVTHLSFGRLRRTSAYPRHQENDHSNLHDVTPGRPLNDMHIDRPLVSKVSKSMENRQLVLGGNEILEKDKYRDLEGMDRD